MQDGSSVSLRSALDKNFDGLIGRDDNKMFYEREGAAISIRIEASLFMVSGFVPY
jgi:hypothetical protein